MSQAALLLFAGSLLMSVNVESSDREAMFSVPEFSSQSGIKIISDTSDGTVNVSELFIPGPEIEGKPTTIYAYYARPKKTGSYPGVVQLHGASPGPLNPSAAVYYANNGFCCISIDWWGHPPFMKDGQTTSAFEWVGSHCSDRLSRDLACIGTLFVRRAFQFLSSRPEVDGTRLCLSGMSAGAHISLLALGLEPHIKAAAVKYGCGYIRELGKGSLWFAGLWKLPAEKQDAWLAAFDPKNGLQDCRASVMMLSGTDDVWFEMPPVLATWRGLPGDKRLVMLPNDNHTQVGNEIIPLRYFKAVFKMSPPFPEAGTPLAVAKGSGLRLSCAVKAPSRVTKSIWYVKRMPLKDFTSRQTNDAKWEAFDATVDDGAYCCSIPAPKDGEQVVAYLLIEDETAAMVSSDTVEIPEYPGWRLPKGELRNEK